MPHDRPKPDSFAAWLARAESDLAIADANIPGAFLEDHCYHAQQCVEKAIKAVLLCRSGTFPYIHDLSELVNCLKEQGISVPEFVEDAVVLTPFSIEGRYPGLDEEVTPLERVDAVRKAKLVFGWAQKECMQFSQTQCNTSQPEDSPAEV